MHTLTISPQKIIVKLLLALLLIFIISNCASQKPLATAAYFRFSMNDESYRIRSVSSVDNGNSYNELIGQGFVAVDYDKDRILDKVSLGKVELAKAQQIYEYGLNILDQKDQLQVYSMDIIDYVQENSDYDYQIKSFYPDGSEPFNEFKIIRKRELKDNEIVIIDKKADGLLDEVLKGPVQEVQDYQARYTYVINAGLEKERLFKKDNMILVKKK